MSQFSHIGALVPKYAEYLKYATAEECTKKMAEKKNGKPLVKVAKKILDQGIWKQDAHARHLIEKAFSTSLKDKKYKKKLKELKSIFKQQVQAFDAAKKKPVTHGFSSDLVGTILAYLPQKERDNAATALLGEGVEQAKLNAMKVAEQDTQWNTMIREAVKESKDGQLVLPQGLQGRCENVTQIDLSDRKITAAHIKSLFNTFPNITSLKLVNTGMGLEEIKALAACLKDSKLTSLYLGRNEIGTEGVKVIAAALKDSKLMSLYLDGNEINAEGATALAAALKDSKLEILNLGKNPIEKKGARALAAALKDSQLTDLYLLDTNIEEKGVIALAAALKDSQLTDLRLGHFCFNRESIKAISAAIKGSKLMSLTLQEGDDNSTAEDVKILAKGLKGSNLMSLKLWGFLIYTDMEVLTAVLPDTKLESLELRDDDITTEGIQALAAVLPKSKLTRVDLRKNDHNIEDKVKKEITKKFPFVLL